MHSDLRTPVAFLIFRRPETTRRVVEEILRARPPKVFVIADGPRAGSEDEARLSAETRRIIDEADWQCEVETNYCEVNLGLKYRTTTGLDWVFSRVDEVIFLEDDTLPHPTFFRYCDELLERYRNDERIMMISGLNFISKHMHFPDSYLFTHYIGTWGWATWRRAWQHLDVSLKVWKTVRQSRFLEKLLCDEKQAKLWRSYFDRVINGKGTTWDHQWQLTCWLRAGLSVMPACNLISNIGFGPGGEHYKTFDPKLANRPTFGIEFPLRHPPTVIRSAEADAIYARELLG